MARTKQTAQKDTGGKLLAMGRGRGKATPKKNPTPGGRADRKVVLEYSSDETQEEGAPRPAEGAEAPKRVKKQIHLTLPMSPAHVTTTETLATFFINHGLTRALQKAFAKKGWSTDQMREFVTNFPWIACTPPEHHKILKTHRILIIFLYFIGNYVTYKNYTQKEKYLFRNFTSTHFSLIVKTCVAIGTPSLSQCNLRTKLVCCCL